LDLGYIAGVGWGLSPRSQREYRRLCLDTGVTPSSVLSAADKHIYTGVRESRIWPGASSSCGDAGGQKQSA